MLDLSREILADYQVRKTKKQKLRFIEFLKGYMPDLKIEEGGFPRNRNIVVGDISRAKVILSAHYDTCAVLPFPNFITPKNFLFTILYSLLICIPFLAVLVVAELLLSYYTDNYFINFFVPWLLMVGLMLLVFMGGKPNKHTANDNTSGVITLCELMGSLSIEQRSEVAFVFFDNEENGLLGSSFFRKKHKNEIKDKLLINFDCVSDGNNVLLVLNRTAENLFGNAVSNTFVSVEDKEVHICKSSNTFYPSDQMGFPMNMAVSTLKKNRILGLYMDRIHTGRDTVFEEGNIEFIVSRIKSLIGLIL